MSEVLTRAELVMDALARWRDAGKPCPAHRWLGWSREEWEDFEELGLFPYPRTGAL